MNEIKIDGVLSQPFPPELSTESYAFVLCALDGFAQSLLDAQHKSPALKDKVEFQRARAQIQEARRLILINTFRVEDAMNTNRE